MQQPCPDCGYVSDRPVRFCRQCGKQLIVETEASSAATRNYAPNQAPLTTSTSPSRPQYEPRSGSDDLTQETTRFYQPPLQHNAQPTTPVRKKSRVGLWILIVLLCFFVIGGGMVGVVFSKFRARLNSSSIDQAVAKKIEDEIERRIQDAMRDKDKTEQVPQFGIPSPPPAPPPPSSGTSSGLEKYRYPRVTSAKTVGVIGSEILKMTTSDSVGTVGDFYRKIMGEPSIKDTDEGEEKLIFQTSGSSSILVVVKAEDDDNGKTQIVVIRSGFQIPKIQ